MKQALIVMAKRPSPGQTKTRLTPFLSPAQAAQLYQCFLLDVLDIVRLAPGITPFIAVSPPSESAYFTQLAADFGQIPQTGKNLNERLFGVLDQLLEMGYEHVAAINSDSPDLPAAYLQQAFELLQTNDVVFGPSRDGGYYLIGWKRPYPQLIHNIQMSTPTVLQDSLNIAQQLGLKVAFLPEWYDVDEPEDLPQLQQSKNVGRHTRAFLDGVVA